MSQGPNERQGARSGAVSGPEGEGAERLRRLELLGLVPGALSLAALGFLAALPAVRSVAGFVALGALLASGVGLLLLWRRWRAAIAGELERLKRAEQEARAAAATKDRLLAEVSHEIRTPMNGILGMTEVLLLDGLTPAQREQLEVVRTSAEALLGLVSGILDLSRIEAGRLSLRPRDFRLRELAGEVMRLLAPRAAERQVDLGLHVAEVLPDDLHGDPVRLRQVLLNLVGNAVRFTRQGSVTVTVEPVAGSAPALRFAVRDTGVGIRPEVQERLFEPFTQSASSASHRSVGTGLGLVISKNLVELMGGEIGFESTRGVGSTFWFHLPLIRAPEGPIA